MHPLRRSVQFFKHSSSMGEAYPKILLRPGGVVDLCRRKSCLCAMIEELGTLARRTTSSSALTKRSSVDERHRQCSILPTLGQGPRTIPHRLRTSRNLAQDRIPGRDDLNLGGPAGLLMICSYWFVIPLSYSARVFRSHSAGPGNVHTSLTHHSLRDSTRPADACLMISVHDEFWKSE